MKINVEVDIFEHESLCNLKNRWCRFMHLDMARECILFDKKLEAYKDIWIEKCEPCKKAYKEAKGGYRFIKIKNETSGNLQDIIPVDKDELDFYK